MAQILLLEPDRILASVYDEALKAAGHKVCVVASAQSAILSADKVKADVIIIELQLVSHSGIEFLYELRSYTDWQDIPVIVLTNVPANEFSGSLQLMHEELGVRSYLYKPQASLQKILANVDELTSLVLEV